MNSFSELFPGIEVKYSEPMSAHTSFKIGGPVRAMVFPKNTDELIAAVRALMRCGERYMVVGNGTNLLFTQQPLDLVVVKTPPFIDGLELISTTRIRVSSGVSLSKLSVFACETGLAGLEFAHGIPGSVGGAVYMNAGAYGGEISDYTVFVDALMPDGTIETIPRSDCDFSYRHSVFSENNAVILNAVFELPAGSLDDIREKMQALAKMRREKQPLNLPSAGSAFKRPENGFAAKMIDEAGLSGFRIGGAAVSEKHAGFIVNLGGASFDDVMRVIEHVRDEVFRQTGVTLEPEIKIIGKGG